MDDIIVSSPLTNHTIRVIKADDLPSLLCKIEDASKAQISWTKTSIKERADIMFTYRALLKKNLASLADLIHQENGKTIAEAKAEVEKAIEVVEFACSLPAILTEKRLQVSRGVHCTMSYRPLGVVASITPFNFPLMIPNWTAPIALMVGNAMILKPSPLVPLSALFMQDLLYEAGLPHGLLAVVNGGSEIVSHIISHQLVSAISFVGSTPVAKKIFIDAALHLKRALCLGSAKNFLLIAPDADPELTAENVVASAFGMAGQRCMAASVVVAINGSQHIIDKIVEQARTLTIGKDLGPIITSASKHRILKLIDEAIVDGANLLLDGRNVKHNNETNHNFIGPIILSDVQPNMSIACTEVFGPVLSIINANSVDHALKIQNESIYGNGASIYTENGSLAEYVSARLCAGMIGVNIGVPVPREPFSFGGLKWSKFGAGDITGLSSVGFWTNLVKCTTKWKKEDALNWMS
jgi:malonate-semialdehyde dehydrogenase (acetylating)/methylmalonate-semialdehyde dehydrogenase